MEDAVHPVHCHLKPRHHGVHLTSWEVTNWRHVTAMATAKKKNYGLVLNFQMQNTARFTVEWDLSPKPRQCGHWTRRNLQTKKQEMTQRWRENSWARTWAWLGWEGARLGDSALSPPGRAIRRPFFLQCKRDVWAELCEPGDRYTVFKRNLSIVVHTPSDFQWLFT